MTNKFDFNFAIPFEKAEREDGWYITALASGPEVDSRRERMAPSALEGFVKQIENSTIPFLNWHNSNDALAEMGEVTRGWLTPDLHMGVEIKLDQDDYRAQKLWKKLDTGKQFGLSVAGHVNDYRDEFDKSVGGRVRTYMDVELAEISLTTKPIYAPSFGSVLRKAADQSEALEGETSSMEETPSVTDETKVTTENPTEVAEKSAPSTENTAEPAVTTPEASAVEKAASDKERAKTIKQIVGMHRDMSRLIATLVIDGDDEPEAQASPVAETPTAKSEVTVDDSRLQKAEGEIARLTAVVEDLRNRTPGVQKPGLQTHKADEEELNEMLKSMTPSERLRFALAVKTNGN